MDDRRLSQTLISLPLTASPSTYQRLAFVDGLRAIAVFAVMLFHASIWAGLPLEGLTRSYYLFDGWVPIELGFLRHLLSLGIGGVDLFLAISGFVLYWPLVRNGGKIALPLEIGPYLKRRTRRIFPPYWAALGLVFLVSFLAWRYQGAPWFPWNRVNGGSFQNAFPLAPDAPANILSHLTLTHGFFSAYISSYEGAYWSLSIELQFYALFIPLAFAARRWGVVVAACIPIAVSLLFHVLYPLVNPGFFSTPYGFLFVLSRWAQFGAGMLAAVWVSKWLSQAAQNDISPSVVRLNASSSLFPVAALLSVVLVLYVEYTRPGWQWLIFLWGNAGLWILVAGARPGSWLRKMLEWRPLVWLGTISYSTYLLHDIVYMAMATLLSRTEISRDLRQSLYLFGGPAISIAVSYVFFHLTERRFLSAPHGLTASKLDKNLPTVQDQALP